MRMRKILAMLMVGMVLFGTIPVYSAMPVEQTEIIVNNLAPDTSVNYKTEPKARKVDLAFDLRKGALSQSQLKNYINEYVSPRLQEKGIDYNIQYVNSGKVLDVPFINISN